MLSCGHCELFHNLECPDYDKLLATFSPVTVIPDSDQTPEERRAKFKLIKGGR